MFFLLAFLNKGIFSSLASLTWCPFSWGMNSKKDWDLCSFQFPVSSGITQAVRKKKQWPQLGLILDFWCFSWARAYIFSSLASPRRQLGFPVYNVHVHTFALSNLFDVIHSVACCCFVCYHVFLSHLQFKQNTVESKLIHDVRSSDSQKVCAASLEFGDATYATCGSRCDDVA